MLLTQAIRKGCKFQVQRMIRQTNLDNDVVEKMVD